MGPIPTRMQKLIRVLVSIISGPSSHQTGSPWEQSLVHRFFPESQHQTRCLAHTIHRQLDEDRMHGWMDTQERGRGGIPGAREERGEVRRCSRETLIRKETWEVKGARRWLRGWASDGTFWLSTLLWPLISVIACAAQMSGTLGRS